MPTLPTDQSFDDFVATLPALRQEQSLQLAQIFTSVTNEKPVVWSNGIVGFGQFTYNYDSGRSGEWMRVGFAPRKSAMTLYLGFDVSKWADLLKELGSPKTGSGCVYFKTLVDVKMSSLKKLIKNAYKENS